MADLKDFAEQLVGLTVKEVNELADILKNEYGIEPAAAAVAVAGPAAGGARSAGASPPRERRPDRVHSRRAAAPGGRRSCVRSAPR